MLKSMSRYVHVRIIWFCWLHGYYRARIKDLEIYWTNNFIVILQLLWVDKYSRHYVVSVVKLSLSWHFKEMVGMCPVSDCCFDALYIWYMNRMCYITTHFLFIDFLWGHSHTVLSRLTWSCHLFKTFLVSLQTRCLYRRAKWHRLPPKHHNEVKQVKTCPWMLPCGIATLCHLNKPMSV